MCSRSLCFISDHLQHYTAAIHCFQKHLTDNINIVPQYIKEIIHSSNRANTQYKNKTFFLNICKHFKDFVLEVEWTFLPHPIPPEEWY